MRYYNENPQVTLYRELAIESQSIAKESQQIAREAHENTKAALSEAEESSRQCKRAVVLSEYYKEKIRAMEEEIDLYESLPWYKRLFYTFKS